MAAKYPDDKVAKISASKDVTVRIPAKSNYEFAKDMSRIGQIQRENAGPLQPENKKDAKAEARALKEANKPTTAQKQGTQPNHHTTSASSFIKPVGGMVLKTPETKQTSTKQKNPGNPKASLKDK